MLKVIGIGYPRTGTMSQKHALEILSLGPCYHMIEVFRHPEHVDTWLSALPDSGRTTNWNDVFGGFQSTADAPACLFWESLAATYKDAKFILTVRDGDCWYESCRSTIYEAMMHQERAPNEAHRRVQQMAKRIILDTMFEGRFEDRQFAIQKFHQHNEAVKRVFNTNQLLVFDIADGWKPLCDFLALPIPDEPFPQANTRREFQQRFSVPPISLPRE